MSIYTYTNTHIYSIYTHYIQILPRLEYTVYVYIYLHTEPGPGLQVFLM